MTTAATTTLTAWIGQQLDASGHPVHETGCGYDMAECGGTGVRPVHALK